MPLDQAGLDSIVTALQGTQSDVKLKLLNQLAFDLQTATSEELTPESTDQLLLTLKLALKSPNTHLVTAALTSLPPLFALLVPDPLPEHQANHLSHQLKHAFLAVLPFNHLGDAKERVRQLATEALVSAASVSLRLSGASAVAAPKAPLDPSKEGPWQYLTRLVQELAFGSKNAKAREQALHYLLGVKALPATVTHPPLRPFTPFLLATLADPDPHVRTLALSTTISLFSSVSPAAKADLKKTLLAAVDASQVTKKLAETVIAAVLSGQPPPAPAPGGIGMNRSPSSSSIGALKHASDAGSDHASSSNSPRLRSTATVPPPPPASAPSSSAAADHLPEPAAVPPSQSSEIAPVYIASNGDLAGEFGKMEPGFQGKETEFNWIERDRSVSRLRGMVKAGVATGPFAESFLAHFKSVMDGVLKAASSLRTTMAVSALQLIHELSCAFGHSLDHLLDPLLTHCLGMHGQTKKIVASASAASAKCLIVNSNYHLRTLQLLQLTINERIAGARVYASAHLLTFLETHGVKHRHAIEGTGGLTILEACLKKGLADANLAVKENSRTAFWAFDKIWPKSGEAIIKSLDSSTRKQLEKADPRGKVAAVVASPAKVARPSMRDMIAAKAKAAAAEAEAEAEAEMAAPTSTTESTSPAPRPTGPPSLSSPSASFAASTRRPSGPSALSPPSKLRTPLSSSRNVPLTRASPSTLPQALRNGAKGPSTPAGQHHEQPDDLLHFSSPFGVSPAADDTDSSFDFASHSSGSAPDRARNHSLVLPTPDPTVDDALRDQAAQAEQAAERLLEIAVESEGEAHDFNDNRNGHASLLGIEGSLASVDLSSSNGGEGDLTPLPSSLHRTPIKRPLIASDLFEDSPDVGGYPGGGGKGNWWMKKNDFAPAPVAAQAFEPDSEERLAEIGALVSSLQSGQIDVAGLRELTALSKERRVDEGEEDGSSASRKAARFWDASRRFSKVFAGVSTLLQRQDIGGRKDCALNLLKELVLNQYPCFAGDEMEMYALLLELREDPSRTTAAAVDAIAELFCDHVEPLYGLGLLRSSLESYLNRPQTSAVGDVGRAKAYALGLKLLGGFFARIPSEVLEEELPKARTLLKDGLNDAHSGDLRRAAVTALVKAQGVLQDEERLYSMMDGLEKDQMNLLAYYISRHKTRS